MTQTLVARLSSSVLVVQQRWSQERLFAGDNAVVGSYFVVGGGREPGGDGGGLQQQ